MDGRGLPAILQRRDEVVAGLEAELVEARNQRRNPLEPRAIGQAQLAVDDRQRLRIACDARQEADAEIKHSPTLGDRLAECWSGDTPCQVADIEASMTDIRSAVQPDKAREVERRRGDNTPQPVHSLRDWLDHLAQRDRLTVVKPGIGLAFELAAVAKCLDGQRATLFPRPGGHAIPVVSGLVSDRGWMAEAMGVEPADVLERFQESTLNPIPWREVTSAPAQEVVHRDIDLAHLLPIPVHNEHDGGPYIAAGLMITRNPR